MLLKVCGISGPTAATDIEMLAGAGVDLVGLWHGTRGGPAELRAAELDRLAAVARENAVEPVLVTFASDAEVLRGALRSSGVSWVQLHAYQLPGLVRALKDPSGAPGVRVLKVLHVQDGRCVDRHLIGAYEAAGVDAFLIDATSPDGRVGSTGTPVPVDVAAAVADELRRPFFLAGGITAASRPALSALVGRDGFAGVDVSTGACGADGRPRRRKVEAIRRAWSAGAERGDVAAVR